MQDPSPAQRQESLYSIMVCHASFGDVELAQITLRGMASHMSIHLSIKSSSSDA